MKLGAVPYLNALPLIHYLKEKPRLEVPAALDRLLRLGTIDLATAPITTLFQNPSYRLVPGLGIGTKNKVRSVRLVFNQSGMTLRDVSSIYLDMESRASALLLKVLLHHKYKRSLSEIQFVTPIPSPTVDASLLIGDKAMKQGLKGLDLGEEWTSWTGLPFTFAAWIGRTDSIPTETIQELIGARDKALKNIEAILPAESSFSNEELKNYFTQNISYELGEPEIEGLKRFHAYAKELGEIPDDFQPRFYPL